MNLMFSEAIASDVFCVLKNFAKFTGKHLCQSFFFNKVAGLRPSRNSEIRGAKMRIAKTNTILKRPAKKLFAIENTYHIR